jgi:hypothetical protein
MSAAPRYRRPTDSFFWCILHVAFTDLTRRAAMFGFASKKVREKVMRSRVSRQRYGKTCESYCTYLKIFMYFSCEAVPLRRMPWCR